AADETETHGASLSWIAPRCPARSPATIGRPFTFRIPACSRNAVKLEIITLLQLDLDVDARREVQLHQGVHRLVGGLDDVHEAQVRADLELVARGLVLVRRAQDVEALDARGHGHGALHHGAGALGR